MKRTTADRSLDAREALRSALLASEVARFRLRHGPSEELTQRRRDAARAGLRVTAAREAWEESMLELLEEGPGWEDDR